MNVVRFFYLLCVCSVLLCCKSASRKQSSGDPKTSEGIDTVSRISIKYAKGFWLEERDGCVVLNIKDPQESSHTHYCLLYTSPSPRDKRQSRMPSSA